MLLHHTTPTFFFKTWIFAKGRLPGWRSVRKLALKVMHCWAFNACSPTLKWLDIWEGKLHNLKPLGLEIILTNRQWQLWKKTSNKNLLYTTMYRWEVTQSHKGATVAFSRGSLYQWNSKPTGQQVCVAMRGDEQASHFLNKSYSGDGKPC